MKLINEISRFIGIPENTIEEWSHNLNYGRIYIPKKSGQGKRVISIPNNNLKIIQYSLSRFLFSNEDLFPVHKIAIAYRKGVRSPIKLAVQKHAQYPYSIKVDMKDFFPSIRFDDLYNIIRNIPIFSDVENVHLVERCCFLDSSFLAIGAPTSPVISNIVMYNIDCELHAYAKKKSAYLSRYADDIIFSSKQKEDCNDFKKYISHILYSTESPLLRLNYDKTRYMFKSSKRRILGLTITPEGKISVGREQKRLIRAMIHQYHNLEQGQRYYLAGYLNYLYDVDTDFIGRLILKYGASLIEKLKKYASLTL